MLVLSPSLDRIEQVIELSLSAALAAEMGADQKQGSDNSSGEGMLALDNGHLLVMKEKAPMRIIEFAPRSAKPKGYRAGMAVDGKGAFRIPKTGAGPMVSVQSWAFDTRAEGQLTDASGLEVDAQGVLYVLSDESRSIGRIAGSGTKGLAVAPLKSKLVTPARLTFDRIWTLPDTFKNPEGMAIDEQRRVVIALDRKKTNAPNLF